MFAAWLILALPMLLNELMCEGALCDPKAEIECSDNNRTCNVLNNGKHECGSCQTGFLEYIMNDSLLRPLPNCVDIIDISWRKYLSLYNPVYRDSQFDSLRRKSLIESAKLIKEHNSQVEYSTYMLGLTPFSADIDVDYGHRSGYFFVNVSGTDDELLAFEPMTWAAADIPKQIDWVSRGAVTLVKDQGRCACSWATGVSAVIEGAAYIADQFNESVSFQQFVSCNKRNLGCDGGSMPIAAKYSSENWFGGVTTSNAYPFEDYDGVTSFNCSLNALGGPSLAVEVSNLRSVAGLSGTITFDERLEIFKLALVETPISAIMKSSCVLFSNYFSGILTDDDGCACSDALCYDHTVLIVGYDDTGDVPFFRVKNSWGTGWGEDGYFRVAQIEKGKYGLFGLLGDGVVVNARQTKKVEAVEVVENPPFPLWLIVAIAFVGFLICCILISITYACWSRSRSEKVASV